MPRARNAGCCASSRRGVLRYLYSDLLQVPERVDFGKYRQGTGRWQYASAGFMPRFDFSPSQLDSPLISSSTSLASSLEVARVVARVVIRSLLSLHRIHKVLHSSPWAGLKMGAFSFISPARAPKLLAAAALFSLPIPLASCDFTQFAMGIQNFTLPDLPYGYDVSLWPLSPKDND